MADSSRIEELRRRVQTDPASIAFAALAEEYRRAGRFEEAIETCTAGLTRHPAYVSARVTLGRALLETGRFQDARAELEHVLRAAPENLAAIRGLAEIHHRLRNLPEGSDEHPPVSDPVPSLEPAAPLRLVSAAPGPGEDGTPAPAPAAPPPAAAALPALEALLHAAVRIRAERSSGAHPDSQAAAGRR